MITRISLKNFKAFGHFEEELTELNLITGLNGVGKSTIIQSLLLLRQSFQMQRLQEKGLVLNGEYAVLGKGIDVYWIHGQEDEIDIRVNWKNGDVLKCVFQYEATSDVLPLKSLTATKTTFINNSLFKENFQYLNAERIGQKDIYPASEYIVSELKSLGIHGEYTTYYLEKNFENPLAIKDFLHEDNKTDALGIQVNSWLREISPGVSVISQSVTDSEIVRQFYEFEYGDEKTRRFRSFNVGFGLNYILPILTATLSAKRGDLLLIENPEAHIHPRGQSRLGWLFTIAAKNGVQLIIESHSDHVLNGIRVATKLLKIDPKIISLFYFSRDIKGKSHITSVAKPQINEDGRVNNWPDGFLDEWDNMLDKLI